MSYPLQLFICNREKGAGILSEARLIADHVDNVCDRLKWVVDFVSDCGGKASSSRQFLILTQSMFGANSPSVEPIKHWGRVENKRHEQKHSYQNQNRSSFFHCDKAVAFGVNRQVTENWQEKQRRGQQSTRKYSSGTAIENELGNPQMFLVQEQSHGEQKK